MIVWGDIMIMTLDEMRTKYPNTWLGIRDETRDEEGRLMSAEVVFTDKTPDELAFMSIRNEGVKPYFTTPDNTFHVGAVM